VNAALRRWYEPRRRAYPWRRDPDPYRVLVSEVMLQQTQATRVALVFDAFVQRFPDVRTLARASRADVLRAWGSLGYNRRAVALHRAAQVIMARFGGRVPADPSELSTLPGVGPYTAAAVASLGYGAAVPAVDVNVGRVIGRVRLGRDGATRADVEAAASRSIDRDDPAAWNQALMDLGREVCRPRPRCDECPLRASCRFRRVAASPAPPARRQPAFEGSFRQVRGAVLRVLRDRGSARVDAIAAESGLPPGRVADAVRALASEGLVEELHGEARLPS
jgi:A/G-specific adenine glycosylase